MLGQQHLNFGAAAVGHDLLLSHHADTSSHVTHPQLLECLPSLEQSSTSSHSNIPSQAPLLTYSQQTSSASLCTAPIPTWLPNGILGITSSSSGNPVRPATGALPPVSELRPSMGSSRSSMRMMALSNQGAYGGNPLMTPTTYSDSSHAEYSGRGAKQAQQIQQALYHTETSMAYSEAALSHLVSEPPLADSLASIENQLQPLVQVDSMLDIASLYSTLEHQYSNSAIPQLNIPNGALASDQNLGDLVADALSSLEKSGELIQENAPPLQFPEKSASSDVQRSSGVEDPVLSLVEQVTCYRCRSCSFLNLNREEVVRHVRASHGPASERSEPAPTPQVSSSQAEKPVHATRSTEKRFLCGKCRRGFFTLDECCQHLTLVHKAKSKKVRLEWIYANKPDEVRAPTPLQEKSLPNVAVTAAVEVVGKAAEGRGAQKGTPAVDASAKKSPAKGNKVQMSSSQKAWRKKVNREQGSFICEFKGCNVRYREFSNLEYHRRCHRTGAEEDDQEQAFVCPECGARTQYWRSMASHLWRLHYCDMELHACDQCNFRTYSLSKLENLHKRIHGDERPFLCDTCGKGFKTVKQLRNHKVVHTKALQSHSRAHMDACEICGRRFGDRRVLQLHLDAVHRGARPFLCSYCGYAASCRSSLKMHQRQHTGEKPFSCDICDYRTADHNSLRRHKMRHSGTKPYKCPYCSYACIQSTTYKSHLHKKHPNESGGILFACSQCQFRTVNEDNYRTHLTSHFDPREQPARDVPRPQGGTESVCGGSPTGQEALTLGQIVGLAHSAGVA
ncbi:zinc finger protein 99-like [Ornithodoros turicata]|uniref:zinc finger protein 99-like n=1 Tax=Ornithodoros turicata TaxID=34597 RepID=UPI0031398C5C